MKISLISGSHRKNAESLRVAQYLEKRLQDVYSCETYLFSLSEHSLPFWDESLWADGSNWREQWSKYSQQFKESQGFVVVSPEWSGMVPSGLKNFFLLCSEWELSHKPALIVTVSAATGGAYPVAELRMSSYKNTGICYIPEQLIVRHVSSMFKTEQPQGEEDAYLRRRADYALGVLCAYSKALTAVRESGVIDHEAFPYGM